MNPHSLTRQNSGGRQPLLWAALALASGITTGLYAWRPPLWWMVAWVVFAASCAYLLRRRGHAAFALGLGCCFILGAFSLQVHDPGNLANPGFLRLGDGTEVVVTAHVTKEGPPQEETSREVRQRLDVETEQIEKGNEKFEVQGGLRLTIYDQPSNREAVPNPGAAASRRFRYGERLRFPAKIYPPRNFRNPGAFDYRAYLQENGIWALASPKPPALRCYLVSPETGLSCGALASIAA